MLDTLKSTSHDLTSEVASVNTVNMTREGDDTRSRLREIARDLYVDQGPQAFSLREVARRAGISAPAVYRHFDGKEALLGDVFAEGFRIFSSYLVRALAKSTPKDRLTESGMLYLQFGLDNPRDYRVIFMSAAEDCEPTNESSAASSPTFRFLVDRIEECIRARVLKRGDPIHIATTIWAHVHGLTSLRISGQLAPLGDDKAFKRFYRSSIDDLVAGLAP
jgi:AcrR family transcriptional regulator